MIERLNSRQFHEADGIDDWRVLYGRAFAYFRTDSFQAGVALVAAIDELADAANHHPDVDLRYSGVTVGLVTHEVGGLSVRDVDLARQISAAARTLKLRADPAACRIVNVTIDVMDRGAVMPFWRAVLGYRAEGEEDLVDPHGRGPGFWFQQMDRPRPQRNRMHIDVAVPHDQAEARVAAALAAGGRLVSDEHAPAWWVLSDSEGNEACVATWMGRWWED